MKGEKELASIRKAIRGKTVVDRIARCWYNIGASGDERMTRIMAGPVRKWTAAVFAVVAALAFASMAFEFVAVDADAEPPLFVSAHGGVSGCDRVSGGLLFTVDGGEDAVFAVSGSGDAVLGYQVLSEGGSILLEGEGVCVPLSELADAAYVFVYALDGSPIDAAAAERSGAKAHGEAAAGTAGHAVRSPAAVQSAVGETGAVKAPPLLAPAGGYPGLEGTFIVSVSISEPTDGFSILGMSAPGGITTSDTIPEFSAGGPVYSNVCSVTATGGYFVPRKSGVYSFQVDGDDFVQLSVGNVTAMASWPGTPGVVASGLFSVGARYPVSMSHYSVGGPARALVLKFAEPVCGTNDVGIAVSPRDVKFPLKAQTDARAVASIVGEPEPECSYEIVCVQCDAGISVTGNVAVPDPSSPAWGMARTGMVTFALLCDGVEIDRDYAIFTSLPEKAEKCDCDCNEGTTAGVGCVEFSQRFGRTPWMAGLPVGRLAIREYSPVARLWTPAALVYDHPMCRRVAVLRETQPLDAVILDPFGEGTEYRDGRPAGMSAGLARGIRYDNGFLVEVMEDRTEIAYNADGSVKSIRPPDGAAVPVEDLGIAVLRDGSGSVTSVVSRADGRMDAVALSTNSYRVAWTAPSGSFVKSFTFSGDGSAAFRLHEYRNEQFQFDSEWVYDGNAKDWTFTRAPGTPAAKTWARQLSYDATNLAWNVSLSTVDATGGVTRVESSVLDVSDKSVMETHRAVGGRTLYSAVRNASGTVASDVTETGFATSYLYDEWNRLTNETSVVKGGLLRVVSTAYSPETALDGVVDRRPRRRTTTEGGVVVDDEETVYASNRVVRIRRAGSEERVSFRDFDSQGRTTLSVDETGRASQTAYSPVDGNYAWTESLDEGVWTATNGFQHVDGRSTRRVTSYDASGNAVATHDYALVGGEWRETAWATNRYSATHKVISSVRSDGRSSSADWICTGPVWRLGEDGIATTNSYDAAKALASSVRYGRHGAVSTSYEYDAEGRVVRETDTADGCETRTRAWVYDERGRIVSETDGQGLVTTCAYSADDLVETTTLPSGGTRVRTINPDGSLASVTGTAVTPEFHTYGVTADGLEWEKVSYLAPDGARWEKTYRNGFGDVVREERPGANASTLTTEYTYNAKGQLVGTSATGRPSETRTYDAWGDVASVALAADGQTRTAVSASSFELRDGEVWRVSSRTISCSDAAIAPLATTNMTQVSGLSLENESHSVAIDVRGNATETWSAFDPVTSTHVSCERLPEASNIAVSKSVDGVAVLGVSHSAVTNATSYDAYRRPVAKIDGRGNATTNSYDSLGRLASVVDPTGATTVYAYDSAGRLAAVTNALGVATVYEYDVRGNKTYEGGGTYPVTYAYDAFSVVTNMTTYRNEVGRYDPIAPQGDTTAWLYDEATGLLLSKTYADGHGPTYTYTDSGNLATRTWARGVVTTYAYDGWNSLTNTAYSDGTPTVSLAYDAMGRQTNAVDAAGQTATSYDVFGVVTGETTVGLYSKSLVHELDAFGRGVGYSLDSSRKSIVEYESDSGRVRRIMAGGVWFTYSYLAGTDLKSRLQYGASGYADYSYEPSRDLLTQVRNYVNGGVASQYDYTNDALGRRTEIARSGSAMTESRSDAYGYNDRGELTNAVKNATSTEYAYQYDDIGNRITSLDLGTNRTYTANNLNQYTLVGRGDPTAPQEEFTPQFDLDGNQTLIQTPTGIWQVQYNGENRPVMWSCGTTNITMKFDRMGRRVEYLETAGGPLSSAAVTNAHHRFVYNGYLCVQRLDAANDNDANLLVVWDPTEPVATRPLFMMQPGGHAFFCTHDGNKNVSEVFFFQQAYGIAAHYEYAPFGAVTASTRNTSVTSIDARTFNPFRFTSEYADDALGLVYYNYRHYEPVTGRWLRRDPVDERGVVWLYQIVTNTVSRKLVDEDMQITRNAVYSSIYAYGRNQAHTFIDLLGLLDWNNRIVSGCSNESVDKEAKSILKRAVEKMNADTERREFFGSICCKCEKGVYVTFSTGPFRGLVERTLSKKTGNGINYVQIQNYSPQKAVYAACPKGSILVGYYHTHPGGHNFSGGDKDFVKGGKIPLYMSYDANSVQRLDPWMTDDPKKIGIREGSLTIEGGIPLQPRPAEVK